MNIQLEIERKFLFDVNSNIEEKLNKIGAVLIETMSLKDEYYDNVSNHFLTLNDSWLRLRNSMWQLKYPYKSKTNDENTDNYLELSKDSEILDYIINLSKSYFDEKLINYDSLNDSTMECLINKLNLTPFASINSMRKTFQIDNDIRIDLDITDFDYRVGEIEVILDKNKSNKDEIEKSIEKINQIANNLGE
jgi:adenylate cyclase class IV